MSCRFAWGPACRAVAGAFTGARRGEPAGLAVADALSDETTGHPVIVLSEDESRDRSLKTPEGARTIPLHHKLTRLGLMVRGEL
jgi:hypothetical protein